MIESIMALAKQGGQFIIRNAPTVYTGLAVGGLGTTVVMGVSAGIKTARDIDVEIAYRAERDHLIEGYAIPKDYPDLTRWEIVKLTWKNFIPTALMGLTTVGCIIMANTVSMQRNAALASLYGLAETSLREYQAKVVEKFGEGKELKVREEISQDRLNKNPVETNQVFITCSPGTTLCYDSLSGRYFKSDIETIRKMENEFNHALVTGMEMYKPLNELYESLGLPDIEMGRDMGWSIDHGLLEITYTAKIATDNTPCIVLEYKVGPRKL